jgi:hypothetical protein
MPHTSDRPQQEQDRPQIPDFAGYQLQRILSPGRTYLCLDDRGNAVVLKRLDADCLHRNQLHPAIKFRLARVRELAHPQLATLRGVERFNADAYSIWNCIDGTRWDQREQAADEWSQLALKLISAVQTLHSQGIVHGSLHAGNVYIKTDGSIHLTDVSPYLYTDPAVDIEAVLRLISDTGLTHRERFAGFNPRRQTLGDLANLLSADNSTQPDVPSDDIIIRWRSVITALLITLMAVALAIASTKYLSR